MYCAECGTRLPSDAKFCLRCGQAVDPRPATADVPDHRLSARADALQSPHSQPASNGVPFPDRFRIGPPPHARPSEVPTYAPLPLSQPTSSAPSRTAGFLAIGAGVQVVIGSLGPWVSVQAAFLGSMSVSGMDGDGKITIVCGVIALTPLAFLVSSPDRRWMGVVAALVLGLCALIGIIDWQDVNDRTATVDDDTPVFARVGWGLQLVTLGGAAGAIMALVQAMSRRRR